MLGRPSVTFDRPGYLSSVRRAGLAHQLRRTLLSGRKTDLALLNWQKQGLFVLQMIADCMCAWKKTAIMD